MKKHIVVLLASVLLLSLAIGFNRVSAQQATTASLIQQTATYLNATTKIANANGALNATATATATPAAGNYVYITSIDLAICHGAGSVTVLNNVSFTSTNITGSPAWQFSSAGAVNTMVVREVEFNGPPLKSSAPGTAVTIVSPSAVVNAAYAINVYWYEAP